MQENEICSGIHYEVLWEPRNIIGKEIIFYFEIHNEKHTKDKYSQIGYWRVEEKKYSIDITENIQKNLIEIVDKLYAISEKNNEVIDAVFNKNK